MGFVYNRPLSIEQIFSLFNKNGGERIDKDEAVNAKNVSIFQGFIVEEGMTLQGFEEKNLETYRKYEELNTRAYAEQFKNSDVEEWKEGAEKALEELKAKDLEELEKAEKEFEKEKDYFLLRFQEDE